MAKFQQAHIAAGSALGELDHPNYSSRYFKSLNIPNVSHQVTQKDQQGWDMGGVRAATLKAPSTRALSKEESAI